jgi:hypothetical protein
VCIFSYLDNIIKGTQSYRKLRRKKKRLVLHELTPVLKSNSLRPQTQTQFANKHKSNSIRPQTQTNSIRQQTQIKLNSPTNTLHSPPRFISSPVCELR